MNTLNLTRMPKPNVPPRLFDIKYVADEEMVRVCFDYNAVSYTLDTSEKRAQLSSMLRGMTTMATEDILSNSINALILDDFYFVKHRSGEWFHSQTPRVQKHIAKNKITIVKPLYS